jgi:hypothetical protein
MLLSTGHSSIRTQSAFFWYQSDHIEGAAGAPACSLRAPATAPRGGGSGIKPSRGQFVPLPLFLGLNWSLARHTEKTPEERRGALEPRRRVAQPE